MKAEQIKEKIRFVLFENGIKDEPALNDLFELFQSQLKEMQQQKILTNKNIEKVVKGQKETIDLFRSQLKERDELIKEAYVDGFNDTKYDFDIENYVE